MNYYQELINPKEYHSIVKKLRLFFENKGFIEVPTQCRLSILAACEDPSTIALFNYKNNTWPLPQTGQMWLEYELLNNPGLPGFFCMSTSYRNEKNPIPGRHDLIFPMFEFEFPGTVADLFLLERDLLEFLGYGKEGAKYSYPALKYDEIAKKYNVKELTSNHELQIWKDYGPVFFLTDFPQYTSPFWNMKKNGNFSNKIDVILHGMETIGSAERSTNPDEMRDMFHTISNGKYAQTLYNKFGKDRVEKELDKFLEYDFFERVGGGIGITRLIRSMKLLK